MQKKRIAIIGVGTVGRAFLIQLKKNRLFVRKNFKLDIEVVSVCDRIPQARSLAFKVGAEFTRDAKDIINDPRIDIVVELIGGLHPAKEYILACLKKGKDVVTANKALLAESGKEIFGLAHSLNRTIKFEAAVAGGVPLIKNITEILRFAGIKSIYGILNGTTNFILTEMATSNKSFTQILKSAQRRGFAEKNPSLDIKGTDSLHKIAILCFLCFGRFPDLRKSIVDGISKITPQDVSYAAELGFSIKLLSVAKSDSKGVELRVHPALVKKDYPLAKIGGVMNAAFINTDRGGDYLFSGLGAGGNPTSLSLLSDVLSICNQKKPYILTESKERLIFKSKEDLIFRYYLRFSTSDQTGVLAKISKILADFKISIASVTQKELEPHSLKSSPVPIVMLTHKARELNIHKALERINRLSLIKKSTQMIRIEEL